MNKEPDCTTLSVQPVDKKLAAEMIVEHHYLHRRPSMSFAHGLYAGGEVVGVLTYGTPPSRHLQISACPSDPSLTIELNRMWIRDDTPKNTATWFISRSLKLLPPRIVVSYADTKEGHMGWVYRAANFTYAGWTDMERKTPRYDYIPMDESKHTREASRSGVKERVRRKPKVKYWTVTGSKTDKKVLRNLAGWGRMDWEKLPPPTEHRHAPGTPEQGYHL